MVFRIFFNSIYPVDSCNNNVENTHFYLLKYVYIYKVINLLQYIIYSMEYINNCKLQKLLMIIMNVG